MLRILKKMLFKRTHIKDEDKVKDEWDISSDNVTIYTVKLFQDNHFECDCPSYKYANNKECIFENSKLIYKSCKHIEYIKERYEDFEKKKFKEDIRLVNL